MISNRKLTAFLAASVLALGAAACGDDDESSSSGGGGGGGTAPGSEIQKVDGAADAGTITVGSKNFPEQYILGNIYADALKAAGFKVEKSLDLGSEVVAYKALTQGEIDAYPEYTGTALTSFFQVPVLEVPKDKDEAFDQMQSELKKKDLTGLPQTPFENTFRLVMANEKHKEIGSPKTTSELEGKSQDLRITGFPECKQRVDCLLGIQKEYGLKFKKFVASQQQYDVLDNGSSDVLFGFTTDGELTTGKYAILDDDKQLFPPYNVSLLIRNDTLKKIGPEGQKVIEDVQKPLTEKVMGELNSRVVLDKQEPEKVAADYLKEAGFVK